MLTVSRLTFMLALAPIAIATGAAAPARAAESPRLTLADAEAAALRHQPTLKQAQGQTEAAEGRVEQARAGYLPQLAVTGTYQRTTANLSPRPGISPINATPSTYSSTTFNYYTFGANASQLLYDFGQTNGRWNAAAANRDAASASESSTTAQVLLTLRRVYFQARAQRDLVDVAVETVSNQEKHLMQIQEFVRAGIRPQIDLAQTRTALANAKVQRVAAENNYAVSLAQLNQAMGVPADTAYTLADGELPPVRGEDAPPASLVDEALRARPELAALEHQRQAQELTVRALRGGYGPSLAATAGATETGTALDRVMLNWFVGLTLNWSILQGGFTRGQVREARGTLTSFTAQEEAFRLQVRVEVEQSRLGVVAAKSSISAAEEALESARDQLRLAEARYKNGLGSAIELGDAQVAYSTARAQEVQARYGLATARAQLVTAMGTP
jgi:outer membrane protein